MDCREATGLFESFREETLDTQTETALREHLAECRACRKELADLDLLEQRLRGAMAVGRPSDDFAARVMAGLLSAGLPEPPNRLEWLRPATLAAAACAAAVLLIWGLAKPQPAPTGPAEEEKHEVTVIFHHNQAPAPKHTPDPAFPPRHTPGKAFVITHKGTRPYTGPTHMRVARYVDGVPELIVDAFPEG